jgi:hypothetical protein
MPPANFNWQTEEDTDWTDEPGIVEETSVSLSQRRWFRPLLVTGLLLLLAGLVMFWQLNRRAKAVTDAVEDDVIASYELLATAADQKDEALFHSLHLTDGRNLGWGRSLDTLMTAEDGLLNGRRPGLTLLTTGPQVADVALAPDLQSAELVTAHSYAIYKEAGVTETITLNQVYNYELQEDGRWLLAAPDDDFWGEWETYESQRLRLSYPTRDEAISLQIAEILSENLDQLCLWLAEMPTLPPCPDDLQFQVRWRNEVGSLAALDQVQSGRMLSVLSGNPIVSMPAPSLVGMPADIVGEKVLIDFYVQKTMAIIIAKLRDSEEYNWYRFSGFNAASLNRLLVERGIVTWPPAISNSDPGSPPIPWPEQAIALTCLDETGQNAALVHLEPENQAWSTELTGNGLVNVQMWPGGYALGQYLTGTESSWVIIGPDGARFPVPPTEEPVRYMEGNGRYLIAPIPSPEEYSATSGYYVLDWEQCLQGDCQWHDIPGYPTWSPDQSQLLLQSWQDGEWVSQILYGESLDGPLNSSPREIAPSGWMRRRSVTAKLTPQTIMQRLWSQRRLAANRKRC